MQVPSFNLEGMALGEVDLGIGVDGRLTVNGRAVITVRVRGSGVVLVTRRSILCVPAAECIRLLRQHAGGTGGGPG
jgi:hypothetical protein